MVWVICETLIMFDKLRRVIVTKKLAPINWLNLPNDAASL